MNCLTCPYKTEKPRLEISVKPDANLLLLIDHPSEEDLQTGEVFSGLTYRSGALWKLCIDAQLSQSKIAIDTVLRCVVPNKAAVGGSVSMNCLQDHIDATLRAMPIKAILAFGDLPAQLLLRNFTKTVDSLRNTILRYQDCRLFVTYPLSVLTDTGCSACHANIRKTLVDKDLRAAYSFALES